jgi:hypothetical protein
MSLSSIANVSGSVYCAQWYPSTSCNSINHPEVGWTRQTQKRYCVKSVSKSYTLHAVNYVSGVPALKRNKKKKAAAAAVWQLKPFHPTQGMAPHQCFPSKRLPPVAQGNGKNQNDVGT